ncbi:hypothetical protein BH160DRAFT_1318 [Burkholderia sp. H160]|nr:hypothetical protein BH160DRAFT_1318 [Burkholderia sp. H160]
MQYRQVQLDIAGKARDLYLWATHNYPVLGYGNSRKFAEYLQRGVRVVAPPNGESSGDNMCRRQYLTITSECESGAFADFLVVQEDS